MAACHSGAAAAAAGISAWATDDRALPAAVCQAETTAYQRTIETLRGVLTGLYPASNTSAAMPQATAPLFSTGAAATAVQALPVGTRWPQDDILIANNITCPSLPQLVAPFQEEQQRRGKLQQYLGDMRACLMPNACSKMNGFGKACAKLHVVVCCLCDDTHHRHHTLCHTQRHQQYHW